MPIGSLESRRSIRKLIKGKIRLGVRVEDQRGRPKTVDYFVLKDVPEVAAVYGEEPKEIDVIFPHRDRNIVLPTWFRWFGGGYRDEKGNLKGGELYCMGTGLNGDGTSGAAEWMANRDPVTNVAPNRPCLEKGCPDFYDAKGNQQCKAGMRVIVMLPKVSRQGFYEINTTAWDSMESFKEVFDWNLANPETAAVFTQLPFVIYREAKEYKVTNNQGKKITSTQYIMKLKLNEQLYNEMRGKGKFYLTGDASPMLTQSDVRMLEQQSVMDEHYFLPEDEPDSAHQIEVASDLQAAATSADLLKDPEVQQLFAAMEQMAGRAFTEKAKLLRVRKHEHKKDFREAVLEDLKDAIRKANNKINEQVSSPETADPQKPATSAPQKEEDSSGII